MTPPRSGQDGGYDIYVPAWGRADATLVLIGEAPGREEVFFTPPTPFVGAAGRRLREWLERAGLTREDCYIDNVRRLRAPEDDLFNVPREDVEPWMQDLHVRIAQLDDPWLIVPMGNHALYALLKLGKVKWHQKEGKRARPGIKQWRGSILAYTDSRGRTIKVIPTPHPAATFREPSLERACLADWERIASELGTRERRLPERAHVVNPGWQDVDDFTKQVEHMYAQEGEEAVLAVDIERPAAFIPQDTKAGKLSKVKKKSYLAGEVVCFAVAVTPQWSLTIPTTVAYWGSQEAVDRVWAWTRTLMAHPIAKGTHNGGFDAWHLADYGVELANWRWDSLHMHHVLDPSAPHTLDFCASIDTREPFWKGEAKGHDEASQFLDNLEQYWTYCGKDAAVTRELIGVYRDRLRATGRLAFYEADKQATFKPLLRLMRSGIPVNDTLRRQRLASILAEKILVEDRLHRATGYELIAEKDISYEKLKAYLYGELQLPRQYKARKGRGKIKTETVDEVTVKDLGRLYPDILKPNVVADIIRHRKLRKESEFYADKNVDADHVSRASYSTNTEAGRLNSSENPRGSGSNHQNRKRETRDIYLPWPGHVWLGVDSSQAESRVCFALIYSLTGNMEMLEKARALPSEFDQHTWMAARIYRKAERDITKQERYFGKTSTHASQRDMQGKTLSQRLLKDGHVYTPEECQELIDAAKDAQPGLREFFAWVKRLITERRYLEDTWGGRLYFTYDRLSDETYRRGYSFPMQANVGRLTTQWGLLVMDAWCAQYAKTHPNPPRLLADVHDSIEVSVPPDLAYEAARVLTTSLSRPRLYEGVELAIPSTVSLGLNWGAHQEWKALPPRHAFDEAVAGLLGAGAVRGEASV